MKAFRHLVLIASLAWLFSQPAFAGSSTITVLDATSGSHTYDVVTDASGHFVGEGVICDYSAAANCAGVDSSHNILVNLDAMSFNSGVMPASQSGTWNITNVSGTVSLPTGAATSANQATNGATTSHTCSTGGFSELGCLGQIDDDVKSPPGLGTTGGITPLKLNALSNSAVAIKSSGGQLYMLQCGNTNASEAYVQIFNIASGSVSVGSSTPTLSVPIAATANGGFALSLVGLQFGTAISAAATTTATGGTAPGTALDCNVGYN